MKKLTIIKKIWQRSSTWEDITDVAFYVDEKEVFHPETNYSFLYEQQEIFKSLISMSEAFAKNFGLEVEIVEKKWS